MPFFRGNQWLELKSIRKATTGKEYAKKLTVFLNWLAEKDVYIQRLLNENDQLRYKVELLRGKVHILMHKTAAQGRTTSNKYDNGTMELCMFSSCCFYYTSNLLNTQEPEKRKEIIIVSTVKLRKTGGNNTPLVSSASEVFCITGNAIDRQPQNGGNGIGVQRDLAYTLTATVSTLASVSIHSEMMTLPVRKAHASIRMQRILSVSLVVEIAPFSLFAA